MTPLVVRRYPWRMLVSVVLSAWFAVGVWRALLGLALDHDGHEIPWGAQLAVWIIGLPLALLATIGVLVFTPGLFRRPRTLTLDGERLTFGDDTITLADATAIEYLPGQQTTWRDPTRRGDRSIRGVTSARLQTRLVVESKDSYHEFSAYDRIWPRVVELLRQWASARPELATSDDAKAFLLSARETHVPLTTRVHATHRRRLRWILLWFVCSLLAYVVQVGYEYHQEAPIRQYAMPLGELALVFLPGSFMIGGLLTLYVAPYICFASLVRKSMLADDPWTPFVPDDIGRYHWMVSGQLTLLRAGANRTTSGLVMRWLALTAFWPGVMVLIGVEFGRLLVM